MPAFVSNSPFLSAVQAGLPRHAVWEAPLVIGVSGGADSSALIVALAALGSAAEAGLIVAHAEYDLRPTAAADREFVEALAAELGLRVMTRRLDVRGVGYPGGEGLEARARRLRYRFFEDVAHETGSRHVAVAHTADDQAETILHRVLRGTGPIGLSGMAAARELCDGVALIRPLLAIRRERVRDWLLANNRRWCEDVTNRDTRYARNFLRHEIISRCSEGPYPSAVDAVVRLGSQSAKLSSALASAADYLLDQHAIRRPDGALVVAAAALAPLDRHLVAEVMASLWRREDWPRRDMATRQYERLADMLRAVAGREEVSLSEFPGGIEAVAADRCRLVIRRQTAPYELISTRL